MADSFLEYMDKKNGTKYAEKNEVTTIADPALLNLERKKAKTNEWVSGSERVQPSKKGGTAKAIGEYFVAGAGKAVQNATLDNINAGKLQSDQLTKELMEKIVAKDLEKRGQISAKHLDILQEVQDKYNAEADAQGKFYGAPDDFNVLAEKYPASGAKQMVYDASGALGGLSVSMLAGVAGKGLGGNAPSMGKLPAMTPAILAQSRGAAYAQAMADGAEGNEATDYANRSAAKEAATEALFGFAGPVGKIAGKGIAGGVVKKALSLPEMPNNSMRNLALNTAKGMAGEGAEEALSTAIDPAIQRATYNEDAKNATLGEMAHDAAVGAILGGVLGGGSNLAEYGANRAKRPTTPQNATNVQVETNTPTDTQTAPQVTTAPQDGQTNADVPDYSNAEPIVTPEAEPKQESVAEKLFKDTDFINNPKSADVNQIDKGTRVFIEKVTSRFKIKQEYIKNMPDNVTAYLRGDTIYINANKVTQGIKRTIAHEIYHAMENTAEADKLYSLAVADRGITTPEAEKELINQKIAAYSELSGGNVTLTEAEAKAEIAADFVETRVFDNEATIEKVLTESPNLAQRVLDYIKELIAGYKAKHGLSQAEKAQYDRLVKARKLYEDGLRKLEKGNAGTEENVKFSLRESAPPQKTKKAYKVFVVKDGKLYPPMVANPNQMETPIGVWLDADVGGLARDPQTGELITTKTTGRVKVQQGGKGTNKPKSGSLAFRPGWHLGEVPSANQFLVKDPETGEARSVAPENFVFAECEIAADNDYQMAAFEYGVTDKGNFDRTQAGLPTVPKDGYYKYRTNARPDTEPWYITGAMKVTKLLDDETAAKICAQFGYTPAHRLGGDLNAEQFEKKFGIKPNVELSPDAEVEKYRKSPEDRAAQEKDLAEVAKMPGYVRRKLDFTDKNIRNEFDIDRIDIKNYEKNYEFKDVNGEKTAKFKMESDRTMQDMVDQYGAKKPGEESRRNVDYPEQTSDIDKTRSFGRTAYEAENLSEDVHTGIEDSLTSDIQNGKWTYTPTSNEKQMDNANKRVATIGVEKAYGAFKAKFQKGEKITADDIAEAELLIKKFNDGRDAQSAIDMIGMLSVIGTEYGQAIQALSVLKRIGPDGRIMRINAMRNRIANTCGVDIQINPKDIELLQNRTTEEGAEIVEAQIIADMAAQVPATLWDKMNAWRYLSMLGNSRTHIRNVVGNMLHAGIIAAKDTVAAGIEQATLKPGERTKSIGIAPKALRNYAKQNFEGGGMELVGIGSKYEAASQDRKIFKTRWLEAARKGNMTAMELEDMIFKRAGYVQAFAGYMKANNLTAEQVDANTELRAKIEQYAAQQAKRLTFQEASALADALSRFEHGKADSRAKRAGQIAVGAIVPFKRTPVNILKEGVRYSPAGLVHGLTMGAYDLKNGRITAAEFVDSISAGLTGTGIMAVGVWLASIGMLTTGYDEDDKRKENYNSALGMQNYALVLPDGSTYTIDWAAPAVVPLLAGAELADIESGEIGMQRAFNAITRTADPVLEMSMLQGIQSALQSYSSGVEGISGSISAAAKSYIGQFVPIILGQVARTIDETKRASYAPKDSPYTKTAEALARQTASKIPVLSMANEPSIDVWGRERKQPGGSVTARAVNMMLSPGTYASGNATAVDREIERLYDKTGVNAVIPKTAAKYVQYDDVSYQMTATEYTDYQKKMGSYSYAEIAKLVKTPTYRAMTDAERADVVQDIYNYSRQQATESMLRGRGVSYTDDTYLATKARLDSAGAWEQYTAIKRTYPNTSYENAERYYHISDGIGIDPADLAKIKSYYADRIKGNPTYDDKKRAMQDYIRKNHLADSVAQETAILYVVARWGGQAAQSQIRTYVGSLNMSAAEKRRLYDIIINAN